MQRNLSVLKAGETAKVKRVGGAPEFIGRLMALGVTRGADIRVVKYAPLGDPIEVSVNASSLTLRRTEAEYIEID